MAAKQSKVIITCAVTGSIHTPSMSPHLPVTPEEIAAAAIGAAEAGAAIVHLHAREPADGRPTRDPKMFLRFLPAIKKASNVVIKEMKFRPKIDEHDYTTKTKHVERFLNEGSKVKITIMFRGREMAHPELGRRILEKVAERVAEIAVVESAPKQDGRNMVMVLNPIRKPKTKPAAQAANV